MRENALKQFALQNSLPVINGQQMVPLAQVQAMITSGGKCFLAAHPVSCLAEPGNDFHAILRRIEPEPSIPAKILRER